MMTLTKVAFCGGEEPNTRHRVVQNVDGTRRRRARGAATEAAAAGEARGMMQMVARARRLGARARRRGRRRA